MTMVEEEGFEKSANQCLHCMSNTLFSYEYNWTCFFSCEYKIIKQKNEPNKIQRKKLKFSY